jgi:hypothetical protein
VPHVATREQVGETLHVVMRQIGHRHALTGIILVSAVHSAKLNFINLLSARAFGKLKRREASHREFFT